MRRSASFLSVTLLFLAASVVHGEDAVTDTTQQKIDQLQKKLDELTSKVKDISDSAVDKDDVDSVNNALQSFEFQYQRDRETKTVTPAYRGWGGLNGGAPVGTNALVLGGLIQVRYEQANRPYSSGATSPGSTGVPTTSNVASYTASRRSTFDVGTAQFFFYGNLYRDYTEGRNLTYLVRFGTLPASGYGTSPQAGSDFSFPTLLDAQIIYSPLSTITPDVPHLTITLGQQLLPWGLEVQTSDEFKPTINGAQWVASDLLGRREIGLIARGDLGITYDYGYNYRSSLVEYAVGLVDGNGPNRVDDNNYKDSVYRVDVKVPTSYNSWLRELRFGTSYYYGRQNLDESTAGAVQTNPSGVYSPDGAKRRLGADIYYEHYPWGFTYEYVHATDDQLVGLGTPTSHYSVHRKEGDAQTGTLFYNFGNQFLASQRNLGQTNDAWPKTYQPFFRFDRYVADRSVAHTWSDIYTLGLNVFFAETTKLQLNFNRLSAYTATTPHSTNTYEGIAQLQFGF